MEAQRRYGVQTTFYFPLIDYGATDFEATPVTHASGDTQVSKDGGAFANTTNAFAHEGNGIYSLVLTATEMEARVIVVTIKDQGSKAWEDQCIVIATMANASAEIPNLADGSVASAITKIDAVDDYVDSEVAAIKAKTDNLPADTAAVLTAIDDFIDTEVSAIKAKTDNLPADTAAEFAAIPTAIENADALLTRDVDNVEGSAPVHSLTSAILKLVSRFVAATGRTYRTDGTTIHMTQTPTTDPGADPVTELGAAS